MVHKLYLPRRRVVTRRRRKVVDMLRQHSRVVDTPRHHKVAVMLCRRKVGSNLHRRHGRVVRLQVLRRLMARRRAGSKVVALWVVALRRFRPLASRLAGAALWVLRRVWAIRRVVHRLPLPVLFLLRRHG